jgi:outer membrane protein OmpA-like peptidoglycan-associated protein
MQEHPTTYLVLAGYASSEGREEYNFGLSRKRTNIVADYLVSNYNISPDRIECLWFGQLNPVGDNSTTEGRRLNRRVEIAVGGL